LQRLHATSFSSQSCWSRSGSARSRAREGLIEPGNPPTSRWPTRGRLAMLAMVQQAPESRAQITQPRGSNPLGALSPVKADPQNRAHRVAIGGARDLLAAGRMVDIQCAPAELSRIKPPLPALRRSLSRRWAPPHRTRAAFDHKTASIAPSVRER